MNPYRIASDRSDERDPRYRVTRWQRRIVRFAQWVRPQWYKDARESRARRRLDRFLRNILDQHPDVMREAQRIAESLGSSIVEVSLPAFNLDIAIPDFDLSFPFARLDESSSHEFVARVARDLGVRVDGSDRVEDVRRRIKERMDRPPVAPPDPIDVDE